MSSFFIFKKIYFLNIFLQNRLLLQKYSFMSIKLCCLLNFSWIELKKLIKIWVSSKLLAPKTQLKNCLLCVDTTLVKSVAAFCPLMIHSPVLRGLTNKKIIILKAFRYEDWTENDKTANVKTLQNLQTNKKNKKKWGVAWDCCTVLYFYNLWSNSELSDDIP